MTPHLKPTPLRAFQVTPDSIDLPLPYWVQTLRSVDPPVSSSFDWLLLARGLKFGGNWNDYLVAPWPDQPDHIEVWTPEQYAARTGGCPYEECIAICDDQEPSNRRWINREETKKRIRQLSKQEGGAHE